MESKDTEQRAEELPEGWRSGDRRFDERRPGDWLFADRQSDGQRPEDRGTDTFQHPIGEVFHPSLARTMVIVFFLVSILLGAAVAGILYLASQAYFSSSGSPFTNYQALLFAVAYFLAGLIVWLIGRRMTRPLIHLATTMQAFLDGKWEARTRIERRDETGLLGYLFNQMADVASELRQLAPGEGEPGSDHHQAFVRLSQLAASSSSLDAFLRGALDLLLNSFNCACAAIYLSGTDPAAEVEAGSVKTALLQRVVIAKDFSDSPLAARFVDKKVVIDPPAPAGEPPTSAPGGEWLVGKAILTQRSQVSRSEVEAGSFEAAIPLLIGDRAIGALDLYSAIRFPATLLGKDTARPFSVWAVSEIETFANVMALAIANFLKISRRAPAEAPSAAEQKPPTKGERRKSDTLYKTARQIAQAETSEQVIAEVAFALQRPPADVYATAILLADDGQLRVVHLWPGLAAAGGTEQASQPALENLTLSVKTLTPYFLFSDQRNLTSQGLHPLLVTELATSRLPQELLEVPRQMGCDSVAFLPAVRTRGLAAVLVLGRPGAAGEAAAPLHEGMLGPYINLIELMVTTLERVQAQRTTQRRLAELQTLWNVSQSISASVAGSEIQGPKDGGAADRGAAEPYLGEETSLPALYRTIHRQVVEVMGELSTFAIALYEPETDTIRIPYMFEDGQALDIAPFPVGEGLTSVVIRTRRPLLLVEDTLRQAEALGARTIGVPAKSWLGVPMSFGGQVIGVIIVQDIHQEHRFDEEDERLLSTLATQVAVVVRNASLLEQSRRQARQERLINEINAKIRQSVDIQSILNTTATALGQALGASRLHIQLGTPDEAEEERPA